MSKDIVIVAARRTPIGSFLGSLSSLSAADLGTCAIRGILADTRIDPADIDEVLMGCILPAGLGQAPARQAALKAGIPKSVPCTTVNKMCGSGMKTVMLGYDQIRAGSAGIVLAGGMESMSNAPYLIMGARRGLRMGDQAMLDHMLHDGLQDPANGQSMGYFAELCADKFAFSREEQDQYAVESVTRSVAAIENGDFGDELVPVSVRVKNDELRIHEDEQPRKCELAKISRMKPAFRTKGGTVTAANSASISDGAAALLMMDADRARGLGLRPMARILTHATQAQAPAEFTTAPIGAIDKLYVKVGWSDADVDLYEINEAFAVVAMAAIRELRLDPAKVNVKGGACALGHPIGATGARIVVTLVHALRRRGLKRGIASLCIGGGEATAIAIEML